MEIKINMCSYSLPRCHCLTLDPSCFNYFIHYNLVYIASISSNTFPKSVRSVKVLGILLLAVTFSLMASNTSDTTAFTESGNSGPGCVHTLLLSIGKFPNQTYPSQRYGLSCH